MTRLDVYLAKIAELADSPESISSIRSLILDLAVQGKLTNQSQDEAESPQWQSLLDELKVERSVSPADAPFDIPASWAWTTLADIGDTKPRNIAVDTVAASFVPMTMIQAEYGKIAGHESRRWGEIKKGYTHFQDGDVVMAKITPCFENGKSAVMANLVNGIGAGTTELHVFRRTSDVVLPEFVLIFIKTPGFIQRGIPRMTGSAGQKRVPSDYFANSPIPLPPLAEQKRIVAKVDELMAVCDRLEAQVRERDTRHAALARAALARFTAAPTPDNLQYLFHPAYDIAPADLRKSILTLAVQGKLSHQDPNDEPAGKLLIRLAQELTPDQRRRQAAPLPAPPVESLQYEVPESWAWARFRDVAIVASNLVKPEAFLDYIHLAPDNIEKGNGVLLPCRTVREDKVISANHRFYPGQIVYSKIRPNLAKVVIVDFEGLCSADMYPIDALIDAYYLKVYMLSESFLVQAVKTDTRVAMPKINQAELSGIVVPVPPLAEQRRIVAKVDHLLSLVDRYESQLATARDTAARLLDALVAELTGTRRPAAPAPSPAPGAGRAPAPGSDASAPRAPSTPARAPADPGAGGGAGAPGDATARLLALLRERGSLSSSEAQAATSLDPATLRAQFKALIDQGLVRTEGQRRGMRYLPTAKAAHAE
jgi:type I restriction enzyme S subunit